MRTVNGRWRLGSSDDAPVDLSLAIDGVDIDGRAIERVEAQARGSARAHRLQLRLASALLPPQWTDALVARAPPGAAAKAATASDSTPPPPSIATPAAASTSAPVRPSIDATNGAANARAAGARDAATARSVVSIVAEGGLIEVGGQRAGGWRGTLHEALARSLQTPSRTWLSVREVRGSIIWGGGAVARRRRAGHRRRARRDTALEPHRLAIRRRRHAAAARRAGVGRRHRLSRRSCARCSPTSAGAATCAVGARLDVHSSPAASSSTWSSSARRGDLSVTDEIGTQQLGLSDLRLGVAAQDGVWHFTAALAGATLGVASAP